MSRQARNYRAPRGDDPRGNQDPPTEAWLLELARRDKSKHHFLTHQEYQRIFNLTSNNVYKMRKFFWKQGRTASKFTPTKTDSAKGLRANVPALMYQVPQADKNKHYFNSILKLLEKPPREIEFFDASDLAPTYRLDFEVDMIQHEFSIMRREKDLQDKLTEQKYMKKRRVYGVKVLKEAEELQDFELNSQQEPVEVPFENCDIRLYPHRTDRNEEYGVPVGFVEMVDIKKDGVETPSMAKLVSFAKFQDEAKFALSKTGNVRFGQWKEDQHGKWTWKQFANDAHLATCLQDAYDSDKMDPSLNVEYKGGEAV